MWQALSTHRKGLVLVSLSALLFSTPGLFTRAVAASGWDVIFWRGFFGILFTLAFMAWRGDVRGQFAKFGGSGWLNAILWATGTIAYLQAYKLTTIADVSLIYGSAPVMAALVSWFYFGERPRTIVLGASLLALIGVAIIGGGSIGSGHLLGDALALWMTVTVAISFALFRKFPQTPAAATAILASVLAMFPSAALGHPLHVPGNEIIILAAFGAVFSAASLLLAEGSKLLPAGETALVSNLEVPLQPALAWLILAELPAQATLIGGVLILVAIGASTWPSRGKV